MARPSSSFFPRAASGFMPRGFSTLVDQRVESIRVTLPRTTPPRVTPPRRHSVGGLSNGLEPPGASESPSFDEVCATRIARPPCGR